MHPIGHPRSLRVTKSVRGILANKEDVSEVQLDDAYKPFFTGKLNRYVSEKPLEFVKLGDSLRECPKDYDFFVGERILVGRIVSRQFRVLAQPVNEEFITKKDLYICIRRSEFLKSLFARIINSSLVSYLKTKGSSTAKKDDFSQLTLSDLREIPIPKIRNEEQQPITTLVTQILAAKRQHPAADTSALESEVDRLVYGLYGLTGEEVGIIEGGSGK